MELPKEFWDIYMRVYDLGVATLYPYRELHQEILDVVDIDPDAVVVDMGCGTGNFIGLLLEGNHAGWIYGYDNAQSAVGIAKEKFARRPRISVARADVESFNWENIPRADVIVSINVLYILAEPENVVKNAAGRLNSGGKLAVSTLANPSLEAILDAHNDRLARAGEQARDADKQVAWARHLAIEMNKMIRDAAQNRTFTPWSISELTAALENAGLNTVYENSQAYAGTAALAVASKP